jgi:hypothetical protein
LQDLAKQQQQASAALELPSAAAHADLRNSRALLHMRFKQYKYEFDTLQAKYEESQEYERIAEKKLMQLKEEHEEAKACWEKREAELLDTVAQKKIVPLIKAHEKSEACWEKRVAELSNTIVQMNDMSQQQVAGPQQQLQHKRQVHVLQQEQVQQKAGLSSFLAVLLGITAQAVVKCEALQEKHAAAADPAEASKQQQQQQHSDGCVSINIKPPVVSILVQAYEERLSLNEGQLQEDGAAVAAELAAAVSDDSSSSCTKGTDDVGQ